MRARCIEAADRSCATRAKTTKSQSAHCGLRDLAENHFNLFEQNRIGNESRTDKSADVSLAFETLFHCRIVGAGDRIANQENARQVGFVGMRNPSVARNGAFRMDLMVVRLIVLGGIDRQNVSNVMYTLFIF